MKSERIKKQKEQPQKPSTQRQQQPNWNNRTKIKKNGKKLKITKRKREKTPLHVIDMKIAHVSSLCSVRLRTVFIPRKCNAFFCCRSSSSVFSYSISLFLYLCLLSRFQLLSIYNCDIVLFLIIAIVVYSMYCSSKINFSLLEFFIFIYVYTQHFCSILLLALCTGLLFVRDPVKKGETIDLIQSSYICLNAFENIECIYEKMLHKLYMYCVIVNCFHHLFSYILRYELCWCYLWNQRYRERKRWRKNKKTELLSTYIWCSGMNMNEFLMLLYGLLFSWYTPNEMRTDWKMVYCCEKIGFMQWHLPAFYIIRTYTFKRYKLYLICVHCTLRWSKPRYTDYVVCIVHIEKQISKKSNTAFDVYSAQKIYIKRQYK